MEGIINISEEIAAKYAILEAEKALNLPVKDDIKDTVVCEVGDVMDNSEIFPQVKHKRWDNECNFSYRLAPEMWGEDIPVITTENNIIKFQTEKIEANFYDHEVCEKYPEKGYEIDVVLNVKPASNVISFTIRTKNVKFEKQLGFDAIYNVGDFALNGVEIYRVTPMAIYDVNDEAIAWFDSEDMVGSYAIIHSDSANKGINSTDGKDYGCYGKVGHMRSPLITDANNVQCFGVVNIDDVTEIMTVTIPEDFYNNAAYPIVVDPDFGYTTIGVLSGNIGGMFLAVNGTPASNGQLTNIQIYAVGVGVGNHNGAVYVTGSPNSTLVTNSQSSLGVCSASWAWKSVAIPLVATITGGVPHIIATSNNSGLYQWVAKYDNVVGQGYGALSGLINPFPATYTFGSPGGIAWSIKAEYVASPLRGQWKLSDSGVWADDSGNGNTLTASGAPTMAVGHGGGASKSVLLDGTDYLYRTNANCVGLTPTSQLIVSAWFYPLTLGAGIFHMIVEKSAFQTQGYALYMSEFKIAVFLVYVGGSWKVAYDDFSADYTVNTWYHLCGVYDGANVTLYKNAVPATPVPATGNITYVSSNFEIGKQGTFYSNCRVDDIRIYSDSSAITVNALYALGDDFVSAATTPTVNNVITPTSVNGVIGATMVNKIGT